MALDIRLDYISKIDHIYIEHMTVVRDMYIEIDKCLQMFADQAQEKNLSAASRTIALARTANESALQSAIKSLCILGEVK